MKRKLIVLCGCLLVTLNLINAKTYYLSPTGNDQSNGETVASAKFSLGMLADYLNPDNIDYMKGGSYKYDTTIFLQKSGTSAAEIKILAVTGEKPVIDFSTYDCKQNETIKGAARGIKVTGDGISKGWIFAMRRIME
jgi:hypothetical protein